MDDGRSVSVYYYYISSMRTRRVNNNNNNNPIRRPSKRGVRTPRGARVWHTAGAADRFQDGSIRVKVNIIALDPA